MRAQPSEALTQFDWEVSKLHEVAKVEAGRNWFQASLQKFSFSQLITKFLSLSVGTFSSFLSTISPPVYLQL